MTAQLLNPKFNFGELAVTRTLIAKVDPDYAMGALMQHLRGDWGLCDLEDWDNNDEALRTGGRLLSVYPLPNEEGVFWILTEADRSITTLLLPSDY
jgi:hypothetical protein